MMQHAWQYSTHRWTCSICSHSFDWPWNEVPRSFGSDGGPDKLDLLHTRFVIRGVYSFMPVLRDVPKPRRFRAVEQLGLDSEQVSLHRAAFDNCCLSLELQIEDVMES